MAKKKKRTKSSNGEFNSNPFSDLKGFAASMAEKNVPEPTKQRQVSRDVFGSFADEMELLGVKKINTEADTGDDLFEKTSIPCCPVESADLTDEEVFLAAMGDLTVNFREDLPECDPQPLVESRRLKQLKQGKLLPEASLDLHGCHRSEVVQKLVHFLDNSFYHGWQTVLVITGKGLHSEEGTPVLRDEVERFMSAGGQKYVAEWGRAPKQYGGVGAIVLFLRNKIKVR